MKPENVFATAFKVFYKEEFVPFEFYKAEAAALLPFLVKAHCWNYEDEYRLFLRIHDPDAVSPFPELMRVTDDCVPLPEGGLQSIVLGCETPHKIGTRVRQLVDGHWPEIDVKKMHRKRDKYELELLDFVD